MSIQIKPKLPTLTAQLLAVGLISVLASGCGKGDDTSASVEKKPRPVEVRTLTKQAPPSGAMVSASVASWKTEEIGFEVTGRIEWVAEPNTDIEGHVSDSDGNTLVPGTPVARIESERYELQVETAQAEVERAIQSVNAATIELEKSIPSQLRAAEAEKKLAETEFKRSQRLFNEQAGAQSDVDRDEANYQNAVSRIEQLQATKKAKEAELRSMELQVRKAQQALKDAERNLDDCTLYSSFRGQIASVAVVPGSVVAAGQSVATIQMMDPIKIEVEVSANDSRRLRKRQRLPLHITQVDGDVTERDGFLYLIDPTADPLTRTFTLTLLMLNEKIGTELPPTVDANIATTDQGWRLDFSFLPGAKEGMTYVAEEAIRKDAEGYFLWRINNVQIHESMPSDGLVNVSKLRVDLGDSKLPFLGNWVFQQVTVKDDTFDPKLHMVAGDLTVTKGDADDWDGDTILMDPSSQWLVRPGDLVKVDLANGNVEPGYFVPMDALAYEADKTYLFILDESTTDNKVTRVPVNVHSDGPASSTSSLMQVLPSKDSTLEGKRYVTRGVHYLRDGERVKITSQTETAQ